MSGLQLLMYLAVVVFVVGTAYKMIKIARMPLHLRWDDNDAGSGDEDDEGGGETKKAALEKDRAVYFEGFEVAEDVEDAVDTAGGIADKGEDFAEDTYERAEDAVEGAVDTAKSAFDRDKD